MIQDTLALLGRWLIHLRRDKMSLSMGLMQPIFFLVLFGGVFRGFVRSRPELAGAFGGVEDYVAFYAAGVIAFTVLTNSVLGGVPIVFDRETGFMDRILAAPVSRSAIIASRFIYVTGFSLLQAFVVLAVAVVMGVRLTGAAWPLALAGVAAYGALLAAGVTALSLALAFFVPHHVFFSITGFLLTPLMIVSSAFVPLSQIPGTWRLVALANPLTHAIDPMRALLCGEAAVGGDPGYASHALFLLAFDVACFVLAVRVVRKRLD